MLSQRQFQFFISLLFGLLASCLTACNPAIVESTASQVPQVVQAILSDPKTFNAILSQESPNVFGLTYEGLVQQNPLTGEIDLL